MALAQCLQEAAAEAVNRPAFIGHIGGDDFVIVCAIDQIEPLTRWAMESFIRATDELYDPEDAERGYVELTDRRARCTRPNLVTLSIGVALSTHRKTAEAREMVAAASEMKTVAKIAARLLCLVRPAPDRRGQQ